MGQIEVISNDIEGILNDFDVGIVCKETTIKKIAFYIGERVDDATKANQLESQVDVKTAEVDLKTPHKCGGCSNIIYYQEYCPNCKRLLET